MGQKISDIFFQYRDFSQNLIFARVNSVRDSRHPRFFSNTFFARVHSGRIPVLEIVFRFCYLQRVFLKKKKNPGTALPKIPVPGFFVFWKNPGTGDFFVRVPGFFFSCPGSTGPPGPGFSQGERIFYYHSSPPRGGHFMAQPTRHLRVRPLYGHRLPQVPNLRRFFAHSFLNLIFLLIVEYHKALIR